MIFSSIPFIFVFLPAALAAYYFAGRLGRQAANVCLIGASLIFYSYWTASFLLVLLGSITWNFTCSRLLFFVPEEKERTRFAALWLGIAGNLALLAYYKYLFPLLGYLVVENLVSTDWSSQVALPLGISFFTFTQIGYLVDAYDGRAKERGLISYMVFVTFFPHLIAGPILHNREILPQIVDDDRKKLKAENIAVGLAIFAIGISKKVLLADPLGYVADRGFDNVHGLSPTAAWVTVLAYSLQLYFDFSGYSDMAIGLARMFGIVFPANFNSPYKAASIIDFWSRWHMTLTRYLTLYLYNPVAMRVNRWRVARGLSTSRKGTRNLPAFFSLIVLPTFYTMGLAGVWHGAGMQFLIFGLLHAVYLSINHAWRMFGPENLPTRAWRTGAFVVLTYTGVLVGQIFFRAGSVGDATTIISIMGGASSATASGPTGTIARIVLGFAICWLMPNTQQIMRNYDPVLEKIITPRGVQSLVWSPNVRWGAVLGCLLLASLLRMSDVSKFLYFQF